MSYNCRKLLMGTICWFLQKSTQQTLVSRLPTRFSFLKQELFVPFMWEPMSHLCHQTSSLWCDRVNHQRCHSAFTFFSRFIFSKHCRRQLNSFHSLNSCFGQCSFWNSDSCNSCPRLFTTAKCWWLIRMMQEMEMYLKICKNMENDFLRLHRFWMDSTQKRWARFVEVTYS